MRAGVPGKAVRAAVSGWGAVVIATLWGVPLLAMGCSPRTLTIVDPCPDSGAVDGAGVGMVAFASCPLPDTTLSRGLVGHWHLDDGAGSSMAHDSSQYGNDGNLVSLDPSTAWVTGHLGNYALETKALGYVAVAATTPSMASVVHQVSLAAWMYLDGPITDYATPASRQIGTTNNQYYHIAIKQDGRSSLYIATTRRANSSVAENQVVQLLGPLATPLPSQTWIHIAGTYDGSTARLYVDGVLIDSKPITGDFGPDSNSFILGGNGNGNMVSERFPGQIDEIVLYNRALTDNEISHLAAGATF